jgi:hypothetical protein
MLLHHVNAGLPVKLPLRQLLRRIYHRATILAGRIEIAEVEGVICIEDDISPSQPRVKILNQLYEAMPDMLRLRRLPDK